MPQKILTAVTAYAQWSQAGAPMRTAEEVRRIFFEVCTTSPLFKENHCGACGCNLSADVAVSNKIALATEHCPLPEPKW